MFLTVLYRTIAASNVPLESGVHENILACSQLTYNSSALWLSGYSDRLEIYFLREQEFESLRRRPQSLFGRFPHGKVLPFCLQ